MPHTTHVLRPGTRVRTIDNTVIEGPHFVETLIPMGSLGTVVSKVPDQDAYLIEVALLSTGSAGQAVQTSYVTLQKRSNLEWPV